MVASSPETAVLPSRTAATDPSPGLWLLVHLDGLPAEAATACLLAVPGVVAVHPTAEEGSFLVHWQGDPRALPVLWRERFDALPTARPRLLDPRAAMQGRRLWVHSPVPAVASALAAWTAAWGCAPQVATDLDTVRAAVLAGDADLVLLEPAAALPALFAGGAAAPGPAVPLAELERQHILRVLAAERGNKTRTARILGIDVKTLYNRLQRYAASGAIARKRGAR